jgi:sec-independent protein translocase protein TatA
MIMGIGFTELLIIFGIVLLLFGTKKLRTIGSDLGSAVKGFRDSMSDDKPAQAATEPKERLEQQEAKRVIDTQAVIQEKDKV